MFAIPNPVAALPPQPQVPGNDPSYAPQFNNYLTSANTATNEYVARYVESMRQQGITVTLEGNPDVAAGSPVGVPPQFVATLQKDGVTVTSLLSIGRMQTATPEELAQFDQAFNLRWTGQYTSPQGELPSAWYAPQSSPGPAPTVVPSTVSSVQPSQTPSNPNSGTSVNPPATPTPAPTLTTTPPAPTGTVPRYNFDQWNWFYKQETGRDGPDPAEVGVADRSALMTRAEWWDKVAAWYQGGTGGPPAGSGGTAPGGGTTGGSPGGGTTSPGVPPQAPKDNTMWILAGAGVLVALLILRK